MPLPLKSGSSPRFIIMEEPVPYVALAIPGSTQPWPNSAPWESPRTPYMGILWGSMPPISVSPKRLSLIHTSGSIPGSTPNSLHRSSSQRRVLILKSWVRLALE